MESFMILPVRSCFDGSETIEQQIAIRLFIRKAGKATHDYVMRGKWLI